MPRESARDSNKRWLHRLNLVVTLSEWVDAHLSEQPVVWENQWRDKKLTRHGRFMKASQYVYGHLMLGRMLYPNDVHNKFFLGPYAIISPKKTREYPQVTHELKS